MYMYVYVCADFCVKVTVNVYMYIYIYIYIQYVINKNAGPGLSQAFLGPFPAALSQLGFGHIRNFTR